MDSHCGGLGKQGQRRWAPMEGRPCRIRRRWSTEVRSVGSGVGMTRFMCQQLYL